MKKYKTGIYVGKYYPLQAGHLQSFNILYDLCDKVYFVYYYNALAEEKLKQELDYNIDERIEDTKLVLKGTNTEVIKFILPDGLSFPNDYLEIKRLLFSQIGVDSIDLQIFGEDDLENYKDYIYADDYVVGPNIYRDGIAMHATLIRREYDKYKFLLHPVVRKRLDDKLGRQKYICIAGEDAGKSFVAKYLMSKLHNSIIVDIDNLEKVNGYNYIILDWNNDTKWDIATVKILVGSNNYQNFVYDYKINFDELEKIDNIIDFLNK